MTATLDPIAADDTAARYVVRGLSAGIPTGCLSATETHALPALDVDTVSAIPPGAVLIVTTTQPNGADLRVGEPVAFRRVESYSASTALLRVDPIASDASASVHPDGGWNVSAHYLSRYVATDDSTPALRSAGDVYSALIGGDDTSDTVHDRLSALSAWLTTPEATDALPALLERLGAYGRAAARRADEYSDTARRRYANHEADIRALGQALREEADRRGWCSEYDDLADRAASDLYLSDTFREAAVRTRTYRVHVAVTGTVMVEVEARSEEDARDLAADEYEIPDGLDSAETDGYRSGWYVEEV